MRRKHLSVQCRTIMSNWQIFGSGQFFNINKVFFGSLCAFTRIFLIHIAIPIKKWWITFSWLAESTTHWDQTILKIHLLNSRKYGCLWWPHFLPYGYGCYCIWELFGITFSWLSVYESYLEWILNRDSNQEWLTEYKHIGIKQFIKYI